MAGLWSASVSAGRAALLLCLCAHVLCSGSTLADASARATVLWGVLEARVADNFRTQRAHLVFHFTPFPETHAATVADETPTAAYDMDDTFSAELPQQLRLTWSHSESELAPHARAFPRVHGQHDESEEETQGSGMLPSSAQLLRWAEQGTVLRVEGTLQAHAQLSGKHELHVRSLSALPHAAPPPGFYRNAWERALAQEETEDEEDRARDGSEGAAVDFKRVVVISLGFSDRDFACSAAQVAEAWWLAQPSSGGRVPHSVKGIYAASTNGQYSLSADVTGAGGVDVFGPFGMPQFTTSVCDPNGWSAAAIDAARRAGG